MLEAAGDQPLVVLPPIAARMDEAIAAGHEPDTSTYNIACAHAMMGHEKQAIDAIRALKEELEQLRTQLERETDLRSSRRTLRGW